MSIQIKGRWKGRLGNNINQVKNALLYAYLLKVNLIIPSHPYFNKTEIKLFDKKNTEIIIDKNKSNQFNNLFKVKLNIEDKTILKKIGVDYISINKKYSYKIKNIIKSLFYINRDITNKFNEDLIKNNIIINEKTLVIYMRSGDLFPDDINKEVHQSYISNPFYFYKYIIDKYKDYYKNYILVCEDLNNPVAKKLLQEYQFIKWSKNNLEKDLLIILSAYDITTCSGTFIKSLSFVSKKINKIYYPSFIGKRYYYPHCEFEKIQLPNFKEKMGKWFNSSEQRKLLIDYIPN